MFELSLGGQRVEGSPIIWNQREARLLGRDGRLWAFDPQEARDVRKTASQFHDYTPSEFRAALLRELGDAYEVSGTGHYLVAHPRGEADRWAQRFEDLYRSFLHHFSTRGFEPAAPQFSLVSIVCRTRSEFERHAAASEGQTVSSGVLGYYNIETNRISLYDMGGEIDSASWRRNAGVLIHEATHQTAFNTGIHSRYCLPPLWLAEGLAMLFEAPGVNDSRNHPDRSDRVNRDRLRMFRQWLAPNHQPELLASLVASDDFFRDHPRTAYAEAWALTFFLTENEPLRYAQYLKRTASRAPFQEYLSSQRTADFMSLFGTDWRMLEARFLRFIAEMH